MQAQEPEDKAVPYEHEARSLLWHALRRKMNPSIMPGDIVLKEHPPGEMTVGGFPSVTIRLGGRGEAGYDLDEMGHLAAAIRKTGKGGANHATFGTAPNQVIFFGSMETLARMEPGQEDILNREMSRPVERRREKPEELPHDHPPHHRHHAAPVHPRSLDRGHGHDHDHPGRAHPRVSSSTESDGPGTGR
jgi:hypothetical protein